MQALPFASQDEDGGPGVIGFVVERGGALVQPVDPETRGFQFFERLADVADPHHGEMLERTGGSLGDGLGNSGRAALGRQYRGCPRGVRGPNDRAQVVGIFHAIENNQQLGAARHFVKRRVALRGGHDDHALVGRATRDPIERGARLKAQRNRTLARQIDNFLELNSARAACDQQTVKRASSLERFENRMNAGQDRRAALGRAGTFLGCWFRTHQCKATQAAASARMTKVMREPAIGEQRPEIPDKLYFRIGEVSRLAGIKPYVLRFWETEFSSLGPKKSGKGHRLYRRKDVELVLEIKRLLYDKRYTIEGARKFLDTRGRDGGVSKAGETVARKPGRSQGELFQNAAPLLDEIRKELTALLEILR